MSITPVTTEKLRRMWNQDGLVMTELQELTWLLRICSNNLNQYAKRANEVGSVYAADVEDLHARLNEIWELAGKLLQGFANIP